MESGLYNLAGTVGFGLVALAILFGAFVFGTSTQTSATTRHENWPPKKGDEIILTNADEKHKYKVLRVGEPKNNLGERDLEVRDVRTGEKLLHGVRPDYSISYWGYGT